MSSGFKTWLSEAIRWDFIEGTLTHEMIVAMHDILEGNAPQCPNCGSPMVLRAVKQGPRAGQQFYGCSKYPNCNGTRGYNPQVSQQSPRPQQASPQRPAPQPSQMNVPENGREWFYAKIIAKDHPHLPFNSNVAASRRPDGNWDVTPISTGNFHRQVLANNEVNSVIQAYRDIQGKPFKSLNPSIHELEKFLGTLKKQASAGVDKNPPVAKSPLIPDNMMSDEQRAIDLKFENMMQNPSQSHMMINALAGSGKTTMLKHLAHKYSKGQKWLYLVFNTKNKVEATEKFPTNVEVRTTNGFLGEVLKNKQNITRMPPTERIIQAIGNVGKGVSDEEKEGSGKLEKARILADGPEFGSMSKSLGIPQQLSNPSEYGKFGKTLSGLITSIKYQFKEQVLKLVGLAKSFALDPRNQDALMGGLAKIMQSYDMDTDMPEVKERIERYGGSFRDGILEYLDEILGYDFMSKDYAPEVVQATNWMMHKTMPLGTTQTYKHGNRTFNLGELRDFSDDLWFAATHADQINWPHYNVVLADEVQDFNEAQKIMLKKLHDAGAKIVAVGDKNQSIYRFRGADSNAFDNLGGMLGDLSQDKNHMFSLSKNFRSRKAILDFANQETHVKNLQQGKHFADGGEGHVTKGDYKYEDAFDQLQQERQQTGGNKQTAFISRTNEPLVHTALSLLAKNVPFVIVGKDIGRDLNKHIGKMARFGVKDDSSTEDLTRKLEEFREEEFETHSGKSTKKAYLQEVEEITSALLAALGQFEQETGGGQMGAQRYGNSGSYGNNGPNVGEFKRWISKKLGGLDVEENEKDLSEYKRKMEQENPVVLTTAHKSKGLEFERVYVLRYDQFPHKKAKRPEDLQQEENAKYVTLTRAMDELHILGLEGQPGYKK